MKTSKTHHALLDADDASDIDFTDYSSPYMTGHGFALRCGRWWHRGMTCLGVNPHVRNDCVFMKTDHVAEFWQSGLVPESFVLVTHNSDYRVEEGQLRWLDDPRVRLWLAMSKNIRHSKLVAIPDGIQNYSSGGRIEVFDAVRRLEIDKSELFYANYTIDSNFNHRARCAAMHQPQGVALRGRCGLREYLEGMARSMFTFCPNGSGVDSCRTWEALYMRSIPVVLRCVMTEEFARDFPMVLLDDWTETEFSKVKWGAELYRSMAGRLPDAPLTMDGFCETLKARHGVGL